MIFFGIIMLFLIVEVHATEYDLIVVRSDIPTDYIIASNYADSKKIPVILVEPDEISKNTEKVLLGYAVNGYKNLLIIGGKEAISLNVENLLEEMGFYVNRLWDWNRYGTAARVAIELWDKSDSVVLVDGDDYQNLLIAYRYAVRKKLPILFTRNSTIPSETKTAVQRLEVKNAYCFDKERPEHGFENVMIELINVKSIEFEEDEENENRLIFYVVIFILLAVVLSLVFFMRKKKIPSSVLTKDEQKIVNILIERKSVRQNELPKITGFSKPKISRLLQELENRSIITRDKIKKTYDIKLKVEIENV